MKFYHQGKKKQIVICESVNQQVRKGFLAGLKLVLPLTLLFTFYFLI